MEQQQQYSSEDEEGIVHDATTQYSRVGQGLVKIPSELQYMTRLTHINLHGNSISKLVYLDRLPLLQNLNCSSNRLTTVDTCLTRCTALRVLNLCSNQLQDVRGIAGLPNLVHLSLAHNHISCLQGLGQLHAARLQLLDLRGNRIDNIQQLSNLAGLCSLQTLLFAGPGETHANLITSTPQYRLAVEAVLPHLHTLDSTRTIHQHTSASVLQHIAATKLASLANVPTAWGVQHAMGDHGGHPVLVNGQPVVHERKRSPELTTSVPVEDADVVVQDTAAGHATTIEAGSATLSNKIHRNTTVQQGTREDIVQRTHAGGRILSVLAACHIQHHAQRTQGAAQQIGNHRRWLYCDVAVQATVGAWLAAVGTQTEEHYEDHTSLTRQIKTLQQQLIDMQAQHTTLQAQLTAAQSAASNHTQHITHLEATLKQQADAHAAAVAQNAEEHCTQQQAMEQAHGEIVKEHKAELERCQKQVEELFAQHAQQQSQAAAQVASLHALVNALQEELTHTQQQAAKTTSSLTETRAALDAATTRATTAQHTAETAIQARDAMAMSVNDTTQELRRTQQQLEKAEQTLAAAEEQLQQSKSQLEHAILCRAHAEHACDRAVAGAQAAAQRDVQEAQRDAQQAQQRVEALEEELRAALEEATEATEALHQHTTHAQQEQQCLRTALEAAHAAVLEEQAGADALADALQQAQHTIQELLQERSRLQQQAQQCSPEEVAALQAANQALQVQVQHMQQLESALHEQQAIHQQLITQRDLAHAACQAARHDAQRAQHAWQQRVQQQQEEVEAMAAALNDARDALQVKHTMLDDANSAMEVLKGQVRTTQQRLQEAQHARMQAENAARVSSAKHHEALAALRQEIQAQESVIESLEAAGADALRRADTATAALEEAQRARGEYKQRAKALQAEVGTLQERLASMKQDGQLEEVTRQLQDVLQERDVLQGHVEACTTRMTSLQAALDEATAQHQAIVVERDAAVTQASAALKRVAQVEAELRDLLQVQEARRTVAQHRLVELLHCFDVGADE